MLEAGSLKVTFRRLSFCAKGVCLEFLEDSTSCSLTREHSVSATRRSIVDSESLEPQDSGPTAGGAAVALKGCTMATNYPWIVGLMYGK